ncbi:MAG TPA: metalloprotease [Methanothermobacter sp.]|jgi:Zn-dependent protease|uniref:Site-2 protease family protein n=1 Tax=Methanothermobacter tenebrarum TaxID=680118 RepID=A0ABM7YCU0_9EURY|nr:metalloprotease [Methanothermobacter tenebrarum]MDD3454796.1 metalloprotease [Methanobacteriales archaeon]MDI6881942.1 metalloprotease [Methanothermobacter sp.]MDX9693401.1 metalloprotease [Methanothermobacter sp.]BDH79056.1 site-2 protease family protein [Methanothermobacter tenebrarum]HHW16953.1 metalloprotease [Methanothermobacter sp.]
MVKFTTREIRDIIISMIVIAAVFSYVFSNRQFNMAVSLLPASIIGVGAGFVFHEIAHKLMAIRYGFWAEYKLWMGGILLALITAYFGFVFAAPGAVYIHGTYISREENGKIALAGPATNILLALFFLFLASSSTGILAGIATLGYAVNGFIAFFNLLPFSVLDGAKVIRWNPIIWLFAILAALAITFKSIFTL